MDLPTTDNPLAGLLTERQALACSLRFYGDSAGPMPLSLIAVRMGISRPSVYHLIRRGVARLKAKGYELPSFRAVAA